MNNASQIAKAGKLLCVDKGSYSDFCVIGFFMVLRDFDPQAELEAYLDDNPKERIGGDFKEEKFFAALLAKGFLLEIEYGNIFLTSFADYRQFKFTPASEYSLEKEKERARKS